MSLTARRPELERHLGVVMTPALWPAWPFLPVVRRRSGKQELGVVLDTLGAFQLTGYGATVFRCNLFELPPRFEELLALPREVFDSCEELIQAGWRVD